MNYKDQGAESAIRPTLAFTLARRHSLFLIPHFTSKYGLLGPSEPSIALKKQ